MSFPTGSFSLGPDDATLTLRTGTAGAMAKAGHSLEIRVGAWTGELEIGEDPAAGSLNLEIDSASLSVIDGQGGAKALTDDDRAKILRTVDDKILRRAPIRFRSSSVAAAGDAALDVQGELTLVGTSGPASFRLSIDEQGHFSAGTEVLQTAFGIEPYSAMMGALKVTDEVGIEVDGQLPASAR